MSQNWSERKINDGGCAHVQLIISRAMSSVCWICVSIPPGLSAVLPEMKL
jgi:hypothetical protein